MVARNQLYNAVPFAIENTLKLLGANLRTARMRRQYTIAEVAEKIGTGVRAVSDAEKGKPSTSIAVYASLLRVYGLLEGLEVLVSPTTDLEGQSLLLAREGSRVRHRRKLDNDF